ncbi:MAG: F0F1 ATP synthase subunit delta [Hyphomicrobiales bacterium]|jgi:F-type H+-transporting ATPase subunit delta|nr:F0F1 ATP synthase subunit delta [Hyphomicrobiales bacterium]|tara:strand:- start:3397 stop:3954 length:558 start_codon:yes stop_codon:yes gene_type:complete
MTQEISIPEVSKRYAKAIFELANENEILDQVSNDLFTLEKAIIDSKDLRRLISSPTFSSDEQMQVMEQILNKQKATDIIKNFINVLIKNRRINILVSIIGGFNLLILSNSGEVRAEVTSAQDLSMEQLDGIKSNLKKLTEKEIKLETKLDPEIMGGIIVKIGSQMIDTSVSTKLNNLKILMKGAN